VRARYILLALGTIALGLALHLFGGGVPRAVRDITGDALWAAMMFWWVSALAPKARLRNRIIIALLICVGVEVTQLYHSPAIDSLRATTIGHLVLGTDFDPRDLVAYSLGVLGAGFVGGMWGPGGFSARVRR